MRTLRDFLVWYNNVLTFLEALDKMSQFWCRYGIDMLKEAISLPGLTFKFEMGCLKLQGLHFSSFHTDDLYQLFKENVVGSPAIIFRRHAEKGLTLQMGFFLPFIDLYKRFTITAFERVS